MAEYGVIPILYADNPNKRDKHVKTRLLYLQKFPKALIEYLRGISIHTDLQNKQNIFK